MVPGDSGGFEKFSPMETSGGEENGKLAVFPGEVQAKRFVSLRRRRIRRELMTRVASLLRF